MGFKIKNSLTGEFEKLPILTLKGEKGETGGVEEYNKVDYMGNKYETLKQTNDANVEYAVKTAIGEFNYLDYDGQHITATDTIEGRSKSAILSGNTLVNCIIDTSRTGYNALSGDISIDNDGWLSANATASNNHFELKMDNLNIKPSTKYLFVFECESNSFEGSTNNLMIGNTYGSVIDSPWNEQKAIPFLSVGVTKFIMTTKSDFSSLNNPIGCRSYVSVGSGVTKFRYMIIEYQQGMENWDIPYFEGMQSVQLPRLTTTGKNLIDYKKFQTRMNATITNLQENSITFDTKDVWAGLVQDVTLIPNTQYTLSCITSTNIIKPYIRHVLVGGGFSGAEGGRNTFSFTTNETGKISISFENGDMENPNKTGLTVSNIQLEKGSTATSCEPYKTNILTVNEDVTLRSNGDICDELNLLTGQLTQRIGEDGVVLSQEVVKTVDLTISNQNGESLSKMTPIEGTMNLTTSSDTIAPTFSGEIPVEAIEQNLESFINL